MPYRGTWRDGILRHLQAVDRCDDRRNGYTAQTPSRAYYLLAALTPEERARVVPHLRLVSMPLGKVLYDPETHSVRLLPDRFNRVAAVRAGKQRIGGNLSRRQRGPHRCRTVHGGGTTPSCAIVQSAGHAYRLGGKRLKEETHPQRRAPAAVAALHAGTDHADRADRRVQPAPFRRPAVSRWLLLTLDR